MQKLYARGITLKKWHLQLSSRNQSSVMRTSTDFPVSGRKA